MSSKLTVGSFLPGNDRIVATTQKHGGLVLMDEMADSYIYTLVNS